MVDNSTDINNIQIWQMAFYLHVVGKHMHDHIISLGREVFVHRTSLTLQLFIWVVIPS
jgi:hypothetical protein